MIKRLSQCIREYKKDAILSPVYVLVESLLDVAMPFVMADLIDKGIDAGNMGMILRYGAILVSFALVALLFGALAGRSCARATAGFARNLRHDMFHHLQVYSFSNIDKFSAPGLVTRLVSIVMVCITSTSRGTPALISPPPREPAWQGHTSGSLVSSAQRGLAPCEGLESCADKDRPCWATT